MFQAKLEKLFVVPADTFDNVTGDFPIGFHIWNLDKAEKFKEIGADVFDRNGNQLPQKPIFACEPNKFMNNWIAKFKPPKNAETIGLLNYTANDFQQRNYTAILAGTMQMGHNSKLLISKESLIPASIYFAVRLCIEPTWLNDRDQFLFPRDGWQADREFQGDCLIYTLFHGQNRISCHSERSEESIDVSPTAQHDAGLRPQHDRVAVNHWIPFTEDEVGSSIEFESHFMSSFLRNFIKDTDCLKNNLKDSPSTLIGAGELGICQDSEEQSSLIASKKRADTTSLQNALMSSEARRVFEAGKELWQYYFTKRNININASFYDIRRYFQGETNGRMNNKSVNDEHYNALLKEVRDSQKNLAAKIAQKVYKYGFLR